MPYLFLRRYVIGVGAGPFYLGIGRWFVQIELPLIGNWAF